MFIPLIFLGLAAALTLVLSLDISRRDAPSKTFDRRLPGKTITDDGLNADFFCPSSGAPHKTVILLGGSEGGKHWSTNTAYIQVLLDEGYCVLVLAYFNAPGLPKYLREIPLEYFERAFAWLAAQPEVVPEAYALFGHSRGAEAALLLASRYPQIQAVAALAPGSAVFPSPPKTPFDAFLGQHSPWSYRGKPLPFVPMPISISTLRVFFTSSQAPMFTQSLKNVQAVEAAAIRVENVNGSILLISSRQDEQWPSRWMADQIMKRLDQNVFPFSYEHLTHEFGHGWCGLEDCWAEFLRFLKEHFN